mgnify:CR=1 FL=1
MKKSDNDPLELGDRLYTIEEFGSVVRRKFGGDNYISDVMLAEIFLAKQLWTRLIVFKFSGNEAELKISGFFLSDQRRCSLLRDLPTGIKVSVQISFIKDGFLTIDNRIK